MLCETLPRIEFTVRETCQDSSPNLQSSSDPFRRPIPTFYFVIRVISFPDTEIPTGFILKKFFIAVLPTPKKKNVSIIIL